MQFWWTHQLRWWPLHLWGHNNALHAITHEEHQKCVPVLNQIKKKLFTYEKYNFSTNYSVVISSQMGSVMPCCQCSCREPSKRPWQQSVKTRVGQHVIRTQCNTGMCRGGVRVLHLLLCPWCPKCLFVEADFIVCEFGWIAGNISPVVSLVWRTG